MIDRGEAEIRVIGKTSTGNIVNVYRAAVTDIPIIEVRGPTGRIAFVEFEIPPLIELLNAARRECESLP